MSTGTTRASYPDITDADYEALKGEVRVAINQGASKKEFKKVVAKQVAKSCGSASIAFKKVRVNLALDTVDALWYSVLREGKISEHV